MQPSNPLILLGIAMIASSAIGVSAAAAEPKMHHQPSSAAEGEATSASATSDAASNPATAPATLTESASPQSVPPNHARINSPGWQSSSQKRQTLKAQTTTGAERLDRLQRDSFIRQQRSESQNPFDRPLAPQSDPLQVEQNIQRQLNLPSSTSGNPDQRLERLQYEQRIRQQLRQQNRPPAPEAEPQSQASLPVETMPAEASSTNASAATSPIRVEQAALSELRPNKGSEKSQPSLQVASPEDVSSEPVESNQAGQEILADENSEPKNSETTLEALTEAPSLELALPEVEPVESTNTANNTANEQLPDAERANTEFARTDSSDAAKDGEASAQIDATELEEAEEAETSQAPESPTGVPPALQDAPTPTDPPNLQDADEERRNSRDLIETDNQSFSDAAPAPEYLNPDPNPLAFPTSPDEVEIVGTQPITLRQAVDLALRNNAELRQAQLTLERTQAELRETQSFNFPTVGANAQFNQQGSESAQRQPDTDFLGQPNPEAGDISVNYGDSTTLGAGIQLDYTIFTSGRRPALIEAARGQVRLQQLDVERQVEQLIFDTATNYYNLQEAGAQVNIFSANLAQAEQSLRDAQALERAGVGTRFDVLQAEVEVANARQDLTQQLSELEISRRELAQQINISESLDIAAADPIEVSGVWDLSLEESIVQAYKNRVELEQSLIQREVAQRNRRAALAQLGPQVGFSGAFNVVNDFDNDFTFLHNYQLGLTVTQSLYDGGLARSQANQQESNISIAESEFENRREQIRFEVERAYSQLDANFANIQTTALAVEQAAEALRLARLRFQAGVGTQTDVLRQQTELARSQVNNLSAILSYNRAIVALERAVSNYPEGYLNDAP